MAGTYENLGKMLSDVLDTGQIPQFTVKTKIKEKESISIRIPQNISNALKKLKISFPCTISNLKKQYHLLLKNTHPDTKPETGFSESSGMSLTIDEITDAYQAVSDFILQNFPQAFEE